MFGFDNVPPRSVVVFPPNASAQNSVSTATMGLGTISGTVSDDFSGVDPANVLVQISSVAGGTTWYWQGAGPGTWGTSPANLSATFVGASSGTWTYYDTKIGSQWVSGSTYTIFVHSLDRATNVEVAGSTTTFLYDTQTAAPVVLIPNNGGFTSGAGYFFGPNTPLPTISGTAADVPVNAWSGLKNVQVRIRDQSQSEYWTGSGWTATVETWNVAGGGAGSWTYAEPGTGWQDGVKYQVDDRSLDNANNLSQGTTNYFTWDASTPSVVLQMPNQAYEPAPLSVLSGTAQDPGAVGTYSGLKKVGISIQINPTGGNYWDGVNGFSLPGQTFQSASGVTTGNQTASWSYTGSTPTWSAGTQYKVCVEAVDGVGNVSANIPCQTFTYSPNAPSTVITLPSLANNLKPENGTLTMISGTATPGAAPLAGVQVRIKDNNTGQYWDNAGIAGPAGHFDGIAAGSAWYVSSATLSNWTVWNATGTSAPPIFVDQTSYTVEAQAFDLAGNYDTTTDTRTFMYDTSLPQSWVSVPANKSFIKSLSLITGTAVDPNAPYNSGISGISVAIQEIGGANAGEWWGGSSFNEPSFTSFACRAVSRRRGPTRGRRRRTWRRWGAGRHIT